MRWKLRARVRVPQLRGALAVAADVSSSGGSVDFREADWIERSTAPGVTKATDFRTDAEVTAGKYRNGVAQANISQITNVYRDPADGIPGTGGFCLRIDHPANVGDDPGAFMMTMNTAWTSKTQGFGTTRFYLQFRLKIPTSRLTLTANGGGWKFLNLATYDPQNYYNGSRSNVLFEHVLQDVEYRGIPHAYRRDELANYTGFETLFGGANFRLQNALDNGPGLSDNDRYCLWNSGNHSAGCWGWYTDEWMTFDVELCIPTYGGTAGNQFRMWGTREGTTDKRLLFESLNYSCGPLSDGFTGGFNGLWPMPYDTGRTSGSTDTNLKWTQFVVSTLPIATPRAADLPNWVKTNAATAGTWYEVPGTALSSVEPSPLPAGATGPSSKVTAWNSFSIDWRSSAVYSAANGGHNDYAGNEVNRLNLHTETPGWVQLRAPTAAASVNENNHYADGRPDSRHSYYGQTVNVTNNSLMTWGGGKWAVIGSLHTKVDSFRLSNNDWNAANTHPDVPAAISNSGIVYAFPVVVGPYDDVYLFGNFNVYRWNRATNAMENRNPTGDLIDANVAASAYDSRRRRIFILGGSSGDCHTYTIDTNVMAAVTRTGTQAANVLGGENGMVYVPAIDAYLLRKAASGGTIYKIDASTFECTLFATSGGASIPSTTNGPYNKFLYAPGLKGCVYVPTYGGNVWFLRVH